MTEIGSNVFCILTHHEAFCQHLSQIQKFNMAEASNLEVRGFISATHDYKCVLFKTYGVKRA